MLLGLNAYVGWYLDFDWFAWVCYVTRFGGGDFAVGDLGV